MVAEPVVGVVIRVAVELLGGAMEVLAAALGVDQNHDARAAAVLRIEISGQGFEFADCVELRSVYSPSFAPTSVLMMPSRKKLLAVPRIPLT